MQSQHMRELPGVNSDMRCVPVHEIFESEAQRQAKSSAVVFENQSLTYEQLNSRANQLAHHLRTLGVGPDVLVGLCVNRSLDMVVAVLGILKAGGAYVPLDPAYPRDRIAYIMEDAHAPIFLTQQELLPGFREHGAQTVLIDGHWKQITKNSNDNPGRIAKAENLAYVIYTSGSTGRPKGVQIEHGSLVNFLWSMREEPGFTEDDVLAAVTTLSFDIAGLEIYLPLTTGGRVVVVSAAEAADGKKLRHRMQSCDPTVMQATPATWRLLLEAGWQGDPKLKILCGGEAFPSDLANKLLPRCGSLWNMYGPTETTIWSAVYQLKGEERATVPIGHPIASTQFHILDERMKPVAPGAEGQLHIGGDGLARGYQNRPDLTAEKFVSDPFSTVPGARLYTTGDLGRFLPDGNIAFLGRMDEQVKIRGYRIELGEIESVLAQHPSIHQCVVIAREDVPGDKRLTAYLVPRTHHRPVGHVLRAYLQQKLPDYMLPSAFVVVDSMPLTPNGKVDRRALPQPTRENSAIDREYVAPRDALELELVGIWENVLGIKPIGVTDNIFDLGVNSLLAAQLFARVESTIGKDLPPAPLFQAPTVGELAALLRHKVKKTKCTSLVPIEAHGSKVPLFCIHGGAGTILLFHSLARRLAPERPVYGLQAQGLYGKHPPHTTVAEMATHYIKEIRTVQANGPYLLGGWCFGGIVAFEMAQQLHRLGEHVDLLAIFDDDRPPQLEPPPDPEARPEPKADPAAKLDVRLSRNWHDVKSLPFSDLPSYLLQRLRGGVRWRGRKLRHNTIALLCRQLYRYYSILRWPPLPEFLRTRYFFHNNWRAERAYQSRPYPGNMLLVRDQGPYPDSQFGWERWVEGTIETHEVFVRVKDHRALLREPAVRQVAETIEEYLLQHSRNSNASLKDRTAEMPVA